MKNQEKNEFLKKAKIEFDLISEKPYHFDWLDRTHYALFQATRERIQFCTVFELKEKKPLYIDDVIADSWNVYCRERAMGRHY